MSEVKVCRGCRLEQSISEFTFADRTRGYRKARCKACENARVKAYYNSSEERRQRSKARAVAHRRANPLTREQQRSTALKAKYGLSLAQYDAILELQDGKCALCRGDSVGTRQWAKTESGDSPWHIDHCHGTNRVRGILCQKCNTRIGAYEGLMAEIGEIAVLNYLTRPFEVPVIEIEVPIQEPKPASRYIAELPPIRKTKTVRTCSVEGCEHESAVRDLCAMHYARLNRIGEIGPSGKLPRGTVRGPSHPNSKLTEGDVIVIKTSGRSGADLARQFGVTTALISNIRRGKTWTHVLPSVPHETKPKATLDEAAVRYIRESAGGSRVLADRYGITIQTVHDIRKRRSWKHVA